MQYLLILLVYIICFVLAVLLYGKLIKIFSEKLVLDLPRDNFNHKKLHKHPVPLGGGIGFMICLIVGFILLTYILHDYSLAFIAVLVFAVLLACVSFVDDVKKLTVTSRLLVHFIAASVAAFFLAGYGVGFSGNYYMDFCLYVLIITGFLNLYNFMDGIDGITGSQTIHMFFNCAVMLWYADVLDIYFYVAILMVLISLGFLLFNWHPAKLFMGDAGAIPIGYLAAYYLLFLVLQFDYWLQALIIPMYYLLDGGLILCFRIFNGEKFWLPHERHFYYRAVKGGRSHSVVVKKIIFYNVFITLLNAFSLELDAHGKMTLQDELTLVAASLITGVLLLHNILRANSIRQLI